MARLVRVHALMMVLAFLTTLSPPTTVAESDIGIGDWWEYESNQYIANIGLNLSGILRLSVEAVEHESVQGVIQEVAVVSYSGTFTISGTSGGDSTTGYALITGEIHRLSSNLSIISRDLYYEVVINTTDISVSMEFGIETDYDPVLDVYMGDANLSQGFVAHSRSEMTVFSWVDFQGENESMTQKDSINITTEILEETISVETPAGEFDCYKMVLSGPTPEGYIYSAYFFSEEVGNFVKVEGEDLITGYTDLTLRAFSHGDGSTSILSGITGILIIGVSVAIVLGLTIALVLKRRRVRGPAGPMEPTVSNQGAPPPPPAR